MSSSPQVPTHTTGAHRAYAGPRNRVVPRTVSQAPPARYEPFLDGLFTYCLSVLCDHDTATTALGDVLALAERRGARPDGDTRAWLYALARWMCLRALADARKGSRQGAHAAGSANQANQAKQVKQGNQGKTPPAPPHAADPPPEDDAERARRRELAQLAWPEAAGTTPEQREALELAVRHQLAPKEVAAVLGLDLTAARELLASAACEVERTRAALAVVETGTCPIVARLTGDNQVLLGTALRRELVRHVDDCPRCRRTAERTASGAWPGTAVTPAALPLIEAPRAALHHAMAHAPRAHRRTRGGPRFDRRGFPMDPKDHAARRERFRARAVTTTVVATVVAAPVLALWAAYRGAPLTGEGTDGRASSASEADDGPGGRDGSRGRDSYENAGNAKTTPDPRFAAGRGGPGVSVEVISPGAPAAPGAGRVAVQARSNGGVTLITLTASGSSPVRWSASTGAPWLVLSQSSGTLAPGDSFTIRVYVDDDREPAGHWSARVTIAPSGAVISIEGYGSSRPSHPGPRPTPTRPGPSEPDPAPTPSGDGDPTPTPPDPDPTPTDPAPTDPAPTPSDPGSTPPPSGDGSPGQG
ncbi:hypothetical protein GCM10010245_34690 [Streptomyces spectabilis]|nr:hypothetical protein [Streptomyces spectabilis]MBB5103497.1 DNA-directed RNA polymerase specialized sigma24 family protein [Streptomyces spectabilis]MCI3904256.1 hypothetical protein [Streptomyces spectabilis]GGV20433.1 hypothetical protein GCM10010245_34690 [Streptomyces spectabilis]